MNSGPVRKRCLDDDVYSRVLDTSKASLLSCAHREMSRGRATAAELGRLPLVGCALPASLRPPWLPLTCVQADTVCKSAHRLTPTLCVQDFDREVKALVTRGKLSSSAVQTVTDLAMTNIRVRADPGDSSNAQADSARGTQADAQLVSTLYRHHRKAAAPNKLVSLYLIDAVAREAKTRQKKAERESQGKGKAPAPGSTTPTDSPPDVGPEAAGGGAGDFAGFLQKLEAVLSKIVLDNWENGLPDQRVRPEASKRIPREARLTRLPPAARKKCARCSTFGLALPLSVLQLSLESRPSCSRRARQHQWLRCPRAGHPSVQVRAFSQSLFL